MVLDFRKFSNRPQIYDYLAEFKKEVLDHYDCVTVGEVGGAVSVEDSLKYSGYETGSLNMVFNFDTCWENGAYDSLNLADDELRTRVKTLNGFLIIGLMFVMGKLGCLCIGIITIIHVFYLSMDQLSIERNQLKCLV